MFSKLVCLLLMSTPINGFMPVTVPNKPALLMHESKAPEPFKFPESPEEAVLEYKKQALADRYKVNERLFEIGNEVLSDPEVAALLEDAGLSVTKLYDKLGFSGLSISAICEPKFGPVSHLEIGGSYTNRPTLLLIDKLHSLGIRFAIKDEFFEAVQNYVKLHKDEIEQELQSSAAKGEPVAELVYRIFLKFLNADSFDEMIEDLGDDVNSLKKPINKWIDDQTSQMVDNNGIFTALGVFLRKLSTGFDIRVNKPGLFKNKGEVFVRANGNIFLATGGFWISWKEDSIEGGLDVSTRSGVTGMLLDQIDRGGQDDSNYSGLKEGVLLIPKWIENMSDEQQAELTKAVKEIFLEWGQQIKENAAP